MNTFGNIYRFTSFGESHGPAIGGVIDGMPAGLPVDLEALQAALDRRRPGSSSLGTARREPDRVELLSGIFEGKTTGTPIGFIIRNEDHRSGDYDRLAALYRPSHADYTFQAKYGIRDHRGGGRASARETAVRIVAGAFAQQALATKGIEVRAYTHAVGTVSLGPEYHFPTLAEVEASPVRCPDSAASRQMEEALAAARAEGDSLGAVVACVATGVPPGLGEPVYGKLNAMLGAAMLSINACKGVEIGMGFEGAAQRGSDVLDLFDTDLHTLTNHSGGIQGGISNGSPITLRAAFKPIATLRQTIRAAAHDGTPVDLNPGGRHDPCVVPRAVPVVEAMTACVLLDAMLLNRLARL